MVDAVKSIVNAPPNCSCPFYYSKDSPAVFNKSTTSRNLYLDNFNFELLMIVFLNSLWIKVVKSAGSPIGIHSASLISTLLEAIWQKARA